MSVAITPGDRFEASTPKRLYTGLRADQTGQSYTIAPDGRILLNVVVERMSLPLTVVTDWRAGLVR